MSEEFKSYFNLPKVSDIKPKDAITEPYVAPNYIFPNKNKDKQDTLDATVNAFKQLIPDKQESNVEDIKQTKIFKKIIELLNSYGNS